MKAAPVSAGASSVAFSLGATAAAELGAPHWVWIAMAVVAVVSLLIAVAFGIVALKHWYRQRKSAIDHPPGGSLAPMREPGERLLREARQPPTTATNAQVDEFMERGDAWDKEIRAILIANDDQERLRRWTRVPLWYLGRPQAGDPAGAEDLLARPLTKRLQMLEEFCRDLTPQTPRSSSHAGISSP